MATHLTVTGADHTIRTGPLRAAWKKFGGSEKYFFPRKNSKKQKNVSEGGGVPGANLSGWTGTVLHTFY